MEKVINRTLSRIEELLSSFATNALARWNGTKFVASSMTEAGNGNVVISGTLGSGAITSTGVSRVDDLGVGLAHAGRNNTSLETVDGLGFPSSQVASSDANTLDDYEEGIFTAAFTSGSGTITLSTDTLAYTKIGRMVFISGMITVSGISSPSGELTMTGLPFICVELADFAGRPIFNIIFRDLATNVSGSLTLFTPEGGNTIRIRDGGNTTSALGNSDFANHIKISTDMFISGHYMTE